MATPVSIPPDPWRRVAALDTRCDLAMEWRGANRPTHMLTSGKNYQREWEVRIGERGDPRGPLFVRGASLRQALEAAVGMAEGNGWNLPAAAQVAKCDG